MVVVVMVELVVRREERGLLMMGLRGGVGGLWGLLLDGGIGRGGDGLPCSVLATFPSTHNFLHYLTVYLDCRLVGRWRLFFFFSFR